MRPLSKLEDNRNCILKGSSDWFQRLWTILFRYSPKVFSRGLINIHILYEIIFINMALADYKKVGLTIGAYFWIQLSLWGIRLYFFSIIYVLFCYCLTRQQTWYYWEWAKHIICQVKWRKYRFRGSRFENHCNCCTTLLHHWKE